MTRDNFEPEGVATPEEVLNTIDSLPDEKISAGRIRGELDDSVSDFSDALHQLILLGEVELCERRGTGPRVWFKHRDSTGAEPTSHVSDTIWRCYAAKGSTTRRADRLFQTREEAVKHLSMSTAVKPDAFKKVGYLNGVWQTETTGSEGYEKLTAVIRKEPVYTQKPDTRDDPDRRGVEDSQSAEKHSDMRAQTTLTNATPGDVDEDEIWTYYYGPRQGEGWINMQSGEISRRKRRPGKPPEGGDGYGNWLSGWTQPPDSLDQLRTGQLLEVQLDNQEPELAVVMNTAGESASIRTAYPDHLFANDEHISVLAVEDLTSSNSVTIPEWTESYRDDLSL